MPMLISIVLGIAITAETVLLALVLRLVSPEVPETASICPAASQSAEWDAEASPGCGPLSADLAESMDPTTLVVAIRADESPAGEDGH